RNSVGSIDTLCAILVVRSHSNFQPLYGWRISERYAKGRWRVCRGCEFAFAAIWRNGILSSFVAEHRNAGQKGAKDRLLQGYLCYFICRRTKCAKSALLILPIQLKRLTPAPVQQIIDESDNTATVWRERFLKLFRQR